MAIGEGHVTLPLMYVSFSPYGLIKQEDFENGFLVKCTFWSDAQSICVNWKLAISHKMSVKQ